MWFRLISVAAGIWLMAAPAFLGYGRPAALNDRIIGPLISAFALVAIWGTNRALRRANTVLGLWLLAAPWVLGYSGSAIANSLIVGGVVILASLQRGIVDKRYGGGWTALVRPEVNPALTQTSAPAQIEAETSPALSAPPPVYQPIYQKEVTPAMNDPKQPLAAREVVVITGASAGVGRAAARAFAREGAAIGLLARGVERLEAARQEVEDLGGQGLVIPTDVSDPAQVEAAARAVEDAFGPIDIWVNNAMVSVFSPIKEMQPEEFKRVTEVTYLGYVYGTLAALKRMLPRDHGVIVQVGSALAYRGIPLQAAYCGAKHAIEGFHDLLRVELLHDHSQVKVTMIQMPALNTPQFGWVKSRLPNQAQPVPPIFEPEVAAEAIVWAAHHPRREVIVGGSSLQAIVVNKFLPSFAGWYLAKTGYRSQQTDQARDPNQPDNLWEPVPGDQGAHGAFDARARRSSVQFWIARHRSALAAALSGLVLAITTALVARENE